MDFSKYEATGNDFILIDCMSDEPEIEKGFVRALCDRHRGVGADGLILLLPSESEDVRMRIFNADGSEAEMCGNGIRALFLFTLDRGIWKESRLQVETAAGQRTLTTAGEREGERLFEVDMGVPGLSRSQVPMEGPGDEEAVNVRIDLDRGEVLSATCLSMGNPHCVIFVDDVETYPVSEVGPGIETHHLFPERTNVEFVEVVDEEALKVRVWERGVGETMACGTGACASLVAGRLAGLTRSRASISLPGGELEVEWGDIVWMTGPARHVFDGSTVE